MSGHVSPLKGSTAPWSGGRVSPLALCVLAPNPSPWTLDGTNTWVLGAADGATVIVVDPGPEDAGHQATVREAVGSRRVARVVLTHGHPDHAEGARSFAESVGAQVVAWDPAHRLGAEGLADGDVLEAGDWRLLVLATPGHSSDSVCLVVPEDGSVLTGDTILGRGTSVVAWPDGNLADYLDSLQRLRDLAAPGTLDRVLPGHGPVVDDPIGIVAAYLAHREARLAEVRAVVESGVTDARAVVEVVYADVPREVWPAAELSVRAQLDYLRDH